MSTLKLPALKRRRCYFYDDYGQLRWDEECPEGNRCGYAHPTDPQWHKAGTAPYIPNRGYVPRPPPTFVPVARPPSPKTAPPPPPPTDPAPPRERGPPPPKTAPPPTPSTPQSASAKDMPAREWGRVPSVSERERERSKEKERTRERDRDDGREASASRSRLYNYRDGLGRALPPHDPSPGASSIASSSDPRVRRMASTASVSDRRREDERDLERDRERGRAREREGERERDRDRERERDRRYRDEDKRRDDDKRRGDDRRNDDRKSSTEDHYRRRDEDERRSRRRSYSPRKEVSEEEKRQMWTERVKALSESVAARTEYGQLHEDILTYERLRNSTQFEHLPAEGKAELEKLVEDTKATLRGKHAELNKAMARLVPRDFFPFAQPPERQSDAAFHEMQHILTALQNDVKLTYDAVSKLQVTSSRETSEAKAEADEGERPRKRRRRSVDEDNSRAQDANPSQPMPSMQELERLKDELSKLDGRISYVQNDMQQYSNKVDEEVAAQLDSQLSDFGIPTGKDKKTHVEVSKDVDKLRGDVVDAEQRASTVLAALARLQLDEGAQEENNIKLREQNEKLRQTISEMEEYQKDVSAKLETQTAEINALRGAVQAYISSPPRYPAPPPQLSASEILAMVRPPLFEELRQNMQPLVDSSRTQIEKRLQEQLDQVNGSLLTQIAPTMRAVEFVSSWVEKVRTTPLNGIATPIAPPASNPNRERSQQAPR